MFLKKLQRGEKLMVKVDFRNCYRDDLGWKSKLSLPPKDRRVKTTVSFIKCRKGASEHQFRMLN